MKVFNQTKSDVGDDSAPIKPVIRTFYDHTQVINNFDFNNKSLTFLKKKRE